MTSYYQRNQTKLQDYQKEYEYKKYNSDKEFMFLKRYQSRIDNHFNTKKYKAEDLLCCSHSFFKMYIEYCLSDTKRARIDLTEIDLHHVIPVNTNPEDLTLWHWTNIFPVIEEENLRQADNRDKNLEKNHQSRIIRFLQKIQIN